MAPLVDYSSDSDDPDEVTGPQSKKRKTADVRDSELPPLPSAFHDLYASTVRVSASDDPALHQGRKRVNPHKVGHWPSHLYIEWHPTQTERATLTKLLTTLQSNLTSTSSSSSSSSSPSSTPNPISLTSFLTSDLGAPQPLHISLSRPIVLSTAQKDAFVSDVASSIRASGVSPFDLCPAGLRWHRAAESARSFLVLRVAERPSGPGSPSAPTPTPAPALAPASAPANPRLATLLRRTNALVVARGQPPLYASAPPPSRGGGKVGGDEDENEGEGEDDAFHISIAWSFAVPDPTLRRLTEDAFGTAATTAAALRDGEAGSLRGGDGDGDDAERKNLGGDGCPPTRRTTQTMEDAVGAMRVPVDGVKVKVGNVVTHVPLPDSRSWRAEDGGGGARGLFGI